MAGIQFNCAHCGASFQTYKCWLDKGKGHGRYCSRSCAAIARPRPPPSSPQGPLTHERLKTLLHYDPETGLFTWLVSRGAAKAGSLTAQNLNLGYRGVKIDFEAYLAHRLAWFYVHGVWPAGEIDHRDGDRANNRISNLRDVPRHMNLQNRKRVNSTNTTGFMGVSRYPYGSYMAQIRARGVTHYLGSFDTPEAAHAAYMQAKRRLHEGFVEPS